MTKIIRHLAHDTTLIAMDATSVTHADSVMNINLTTEIKKSLELMQKDGRVSLSETVCSPGDPPSAKALALTPILSR